MELTKYFKQIQRVLNTYLNTYEEFTSDPTSKLPEIKGRTYTYSLTYHNRVELDVKVLNGSRVIIHIELNSFSSKESMLEDIKDLNSQIKQYLESHSEADLKRIWVKPT